MIEAKLEPNVLPFLLYVHSLLNSITVNESGDVHTTMPTLHVNLSSDLGVKQGVGCRGEGGT